jgi:RNA 3'-terminal phosphate cyclase (ATP)
VTIEIDGSLGEGGGQVLRTALTLSMCLGKPIVVGNIRAGRKKPGLLRQHLAVVRAAQAITQAEVSGAELGSRRVTFAPGRIRAGNYGFPIGSAGSVTLLMQTILPALALAGEPSRVNIQGGTHNGMAPSVDFIEQAFLPAVKQIGLEVQSRLECHGFYPNGGGSWHVEIEPWRGPSVRLAMTERGEVVSRRAVAKVSNLRRHIAERELERVTSRLGWTGEELAVEEVESPGPGNIVSLRCVHERLTAVFESVGALGVTAERVAGRAIRDARRYAMGGYAVCEHLADQLLVPMVLGQGGEFLTGELTEHTRTNIRVIEQMLGEALIQVCEREGTDTTCTLISIPRGMALAR